MTAECEHKWRLWYGEFNKVAQFIEEASLNLPGYGQGVRYILKNVCENCDAVTAGAHLEKAKLTDLHLVDEPIDLVTVEEFEKLMINKYRPGMYHHEQALSGRIIPTKPIIIGKRSSR